MYVYVAGECGAQHTDGQKPGLGGSQAGSESASPPCFCCDPDQVS